MQATLKDKTVEKILGLILLLILFHIADGLNSEDVMVRQTQQEEIADFALAGGY